jgi:hypothetical protein
MVVIYDMITMALTTKPERVNIITLQARRKEKWRSNNWRHDLRKLIDKPLEPFCPLMT